MLTRSPPTMRLLSTTSLHLVEFHESRPPYAILSHTWGNEEISLQELQEIENSSGSHGCQKAGYKKIKRACQEAQCRQYEWIWIDTCCIDKTNHNELSEAINSMFRWYQEAEVCFVYLEDVSLDKEPLGVPLEKGRWFTRGWTLQELIAPRDVEFFATDWTPIGSKAELVYEISSITGIHTSVLKSTCNRPVQTFSIAQRMSWAAHRITTKPEDIAYCLLGLFDVSMPLLYGEGRRKAFDRLQEEIMKDSDDQSLFAWTRSSEDPASLHSLLATSPADFAVSGDIVPFHDGRRSNPFSTTNAGLRITLPTRLCWDDRVLRLILDRAALRICLLNCVWESQSDKRVALYLCRLMDDGDQYARVNVQKPHFVSFPPMPFKHDTAGEHSFIETFYVRKAVSGEGRKFQFRGHELKKYVSWLIKRLCYYLAPSYEVEYVVRRPNYVLETRRGVSFKAVCLWALALVYGPSLAWRWWVASSLDAGCRENVQVAFAPAGVMLPWSLLFQYSSRLAVNMLPWVVLLVQVLVQVLVYAPCAFLLVIMPWVLLYMYVPRNILLVLIPCALLLAIP